MVGDGTHTMPLVFWAGLVLSEEKFPQYMSDQIDSLLRSVIKHGASDLFLSENAVARTKIGGELMMLGEEPITLEELASFWRKCDADPTYDGDRDTSFVSEEGVRFRVNLHRHTGQLGAVLRRINTEIPDLESLGLPAELLQNWVKRPSGLVLVTGATGSGKSTTLASALEWVNQNMARHIVTIEDPIEFLFESKTSYFTQREVFTDTDSFARGLRSSLRQAPDVILLGEIRDHETATTALQAAETGHLVLSTMHSANVAETIERLTNLFLPDERSSQLLLLSSQLIGVLCQKLLPGINGLEVVVEHMENEGVTRKYVREEKTVELVDFITRGDNVHNKLFLSSLVDAAKSGRISPEVAEQSSGSAADFNRAMRGIQ
jgi:pilus retraction protein PilT